MQRERAVALSDLAPIIFRNQETTVIRRERRRSFPGRIAGRIVAGRAREDAVRAAGAMFRRI
jgi:hypothetical protein